MEPTAATPTAAPTAEVGNGQGHGFGTMPVFLAAISTILGAVMFLRFGYAVGHTGLAGAVAIILLGHMVTVPTALAIAEIATNRKVEGGGEYFIISRSFGQTVGSVIGISLYLSQAISVAFYLIAFAEAFRFADPLLRQWIGVAYDPRMVSVPATILLVGLVLARGADLGVKALYVVVGVLATSLLLFFLGDPVPGFEPGRVMLNAHVDDPDDFFLVFAICFPAFTGMTAGVGLSGDLANPRRSIPTGTLAATLFGMVVYVLIVVKLATSAPAEALAGDQLVMQDIALWGPIIPIGLACATLSSAIGSILVAPRTLQAIGGDGSLPWARLNQRLAAGVGPANEPRTATLVTGLFAVGIAAAGSVDFVARLISMFFMVTYGALCAISFLEHLASRPSYRPSFRSRWYISLFGALMCGFAMLQMDPLYALLAVVSMAGLYWVVARSAPERANDLAEMFQGVMTQTARWLQLQVQRRGERPDRADGEWRPSVLMVSSTTFERRAPLQFLRWVCHRYGFGNYLHFMQGTLSPATFAESERVKRRLIRLAEDQRSSVYMDTIVSPSMISALAQSLQIPGVSGLDNNALMFELSEHDEGERYAAVVDHALFASSASMSLLVLRHCDLHFGERQRVHIWLTWNDRENANLMILLSYILLGHPDWAHAEISVFAALPTEEVAERRAEFSALIAEGRIPISEKNVRFLPTNDVAAYRALVRALSAEADLTIVGFTVDGLRERGPELLHAHRGLGDVLFVNAAQHIAIE